MKIDWQKLTARERNELVAIKVLGWVKETRRMYGGVKSRKGLGFNTKLELGHRDRDFIPEGSGTLPEYTDKVAVAMLLIMENFEAFQIWRERRTQLFHVEIYGGGNPAAAISLSLPEAICLAALKAKGVCFV